MVKTSPSYAGGAGSIPGQGAKIPRALQPKNQNRKQKRPAWQADSLPAEPPGV